MQHVRLAQYIAIIILNIQGLACQVVSAETGDCCRLRAKCQLTPIENLNTVPWQIYQTPTLIALVNADIEDSLDLILAEFDRDLQQLNKEKFKISSGINQISKLEINLGEARESHDVQTKLNDQIETTKELIHKASDRLHMLVKKSSILSVLALGASVG